MGTRPIQIEETQRQNHCREIQHLPLCRLQRIRHRSAPKSGYCKRRNDEGDKTDGEGN
ncbi:MAG: hypothetical protein OEW67_13355 [Cyclobacteriaceae bacterium]|nr:hypothetical protein [Cyclobacteriaceae bacterium]